MLNKIKIVFLTGTRADYGKLKPLIKAVSKTQKIHGSIVVTGMHLIKKYGNTYLEIEKDNLLPVHKILDENYRDHDIAHAVSHTTYELAEYLRNNKPDLLVVHGDRGDALAGAIAALSSNVKIAHIEGGESSGTVDEMFRHAISKLSHLHFVSNVSAKQCLIGMGEPSKYIYTIGSPELDILSGTLPSISDVHNRYDIQFENYSILIYHSVTTEVLHIKKYVEALCKAVVRSKRNFIVIYPNNDPGGREILQGYKKYFSNSAKFKIFPSLRFEYFLSILRKCDLIIGNSSCGVREAPFFGTHSINLGTRQNNRTSNPLIHNVHMDEDSILNALKLDNTKVIEKSIEFGDGKSADKFIKVIENLDMHSIDIQKSSL